ncbi:bifunctional sugar-1-phosphate nucleotidylyltransferase/acetyltransferase [Geoglobus ahangari]|nr:bifunctional sugar-1-phosphate nucleotidylyltransferase/acetyltransferase [Geoglobus ahangari]
MQAVILAAGEGTRMRPLTYTKPKVMLPVANKPILEHVIENLAKAGVDEVVLVVGYKEETVRGYFGSEFNGVKVRYVRQGKQLGTAHALLSAEHVLDERFLMLNGDAIVFSEDLRKILGEKSAIAVREVPNPQDFGVVELKDGFVRRIIEKPSSPPSNLINAGIYLFTKEIVEYLKRTPLSVRGEYEITDSISMAIADGMEFKAVRIEGWIDVGYPWDLLKANEALLSALEPRIDGEVEDGAVIKGNVVIGEGTVVMAGSYIVGPAIIGRNCRIGPNCYIRPFTSIGDNCHVGNAVEVKNSIIMSNTKVPHLNYVGDSVIGENCNFGAGTKIANLRLDEGEVVVNVKGKAVRTGRKKFGAAIGDNVKTGINASINVGSMIGNDVFIGPGAVVSGFVEPNSRVF